MRKGPHGREKQYEVIGILFKRVPKRWRALVAEDWRQTLTLLGALEEFENRSLEIDITLISSNQRN